MKRQLRDYSKLDIWQRGHALTLDVYRATQAFPKEERYGLTSQLRRSCASIPALIAEGCGRGTPRELGRYLGMAHGSASETGYHLLLATDLGYWGRDQGLDLGARADELGRMIHGYWRKVAGDVLRES